jgi:WD40 repeat protein
MVENVRARWCVCERARVRACVRAVAVQTPDPQPTDTAKVHTHTRAQRRWRESMDAQDVSAEGGAQPSDPTKPEPVASTHKPIALDVSRTTEGGERNLSGGDFLTTARAANDVAITVRGSKKTAFTCHMHLTPTSLGDSKVMSAWRPGSSAQLAVATEKDGSGLLILYDLAAKPTPRATATHNLGPGQPIKLDWSPDGYTLAIMQQGVGIFLWDVSVPGPPLRLAPSITCAATFSMWSKRFQQLAIGTSGGKVIIFNKPQGVMQLHEKKGKHGAAVTCGDWTDDNRLGLASGTRVKICKPLSETGAQWESHSKFKLSGMMSRVPKKFMVSGAPKLLSFSLSFPPFVAVCIGDNYMLVFGTNTASNVDEDVGLTFPDDYGPISGFQWLENDVVMVALGAGYCTTVDFGSMVRMRRQQGLPDAVRATGTSKVFNSYLTCVAYSPKSKRIACVGDNGVKIVVREGGDLEVLVDHTLDYELTTGKCLDSCKWDESGTRVVITATNGHLWCYDFGGG